MNYLSVYNQIIDKAKTRNTIKGGSVIVETHHIIPTHCGGNNAKKNLVNLTTREHFICHLLLAKIYKDTKFYAGMCRAVIAMSERGSKSSRSYQAVKEAHIQNLKNQTISDKQKQAISNANKGNKSRTGQTWSKEQYLKHQATWSEERRNEESIKRIGQNAGTKNGMFGVVSPNKGQTGELSPLFRISKTTVKCPHCQTEGGKPSMVRWHFDNCKFNKPKEINVN